MDTVLWRERQHRNDRRGGRRRPDGWTQAKEYIQKQVDDAAEADAALMDGHTCIANPFAAHHSAAEADAALMDGHLVRWSARSSIAAAEADAALMDGHVRQLSRLGWGKGPRRPTPP